MPTPERTCIGCRKKRERENLIRLDVGDGVVCVAGRRVHGRSAYLCPDAHCLEQALRNAEFSPSAENVWQWKSTPIDGAVAVINGRNLAGED